MRKNRDGIARFQDIPEDAFSRVVVSSSYMTGSIVVVDGGLTL
ncbi:hypothetical protein [Paenibacillus sp. UASWS1643]|nr:hypothetical protein [Paenibacillus sp. UASWS1643]